MIVDYQSAKVGKKVLGVVFWILGFGCWMLGFERRLKHFHVPCSLFLVLLFV